MSRLGLAVAADADSQLLLDWEDGSLTDQSGQSQTVTATGSPTYLEGYFGDGVKLATSSDYLNVTGAASLNWAGDFSLECWFKLDSLSATTYLFTRTGTNDAWQVSISTAGVITWTVWDSGATSDALTASLVTLRVGRWYNIRFGFDAGTAMFIDLDGSRVAYETTALANVRSTGLANILIGKDDADVPAGQFLGQISNLRFRDALDTDAATMSCRLGPDRITRRRFHFVDLDLSEMVQAETWTTDGGGFYLPFASTDLSGFIFDRDDVVSVIETDANVEVTYTEVGNIVDLKAGTDNWFLDEAQSRLYVSEDPSTLDYLLFKVRLRLCDLGKVVSGRYYASAVLSADALERATAPIFKPFPAGGGHSLELAVRNAAFAGLSIFSEHGSDIIWIKSTGKLRILSDSLPWAEAIAAGRGIVESEPDISTDVARIDFLSDQTLLFRLTKPNRPNKVDWPNLTEDADYTWPLIVGLGHLRVRCIRVDTALVGGGFKYKICDHAISRIDSVSTSVGGTIYNMTSIDLSDSTFVAVPPDALADTLVANLDGFGSPTTATDAGPLTSFGDPDDCYTKAKDIISNILQTFAGVTAAEVSDASWAATDARVKIFLRHVAGIDSANAFTQIMESLLPQSLTFLYPLAAGGWAWEDVVKADSVDWTLRDADIASEQWQVDVSNLSAAAHAEALTYFTDLDQIGESSTLNLDADIKYNIQSSWKPPGTELTWFYAKTSLDAWLTAVRKHLEQPSLFYSARVSTRFLRAELFDVVDVQATSRPSTLSRFRIYRIKPEADGTVTLGLFSEELFGATGSSDNAARDGISPMKYLRVGDTTPISLSPTGGPTVIAETFTPLGIGALTTETGETIAIESGTTHRFSAYAKRIDGGTDTDLTLDIYDQDAAAVIATISSVSTTVGFVSTTTFANIPTGNARLVMRYTGANSATGELTAATWTAKEVTPAFSKWSNPHVVVAWGDNAGQSLSTSSITHVTNSPFFKYGVNVVSDPAFEMFVIYADAGGGSGFEVYLSAVDDTGGSDTDTSTITGISSAGFYSVRPTWSAGGEHHVRYKLDSGGPATLYGFSIIRIEAV